MTAAPDPREAAKQAVGRRAAELVRDGMRVGLGTGSTAHWVIVALAERGLRVTCTATSDRSARLAREHGLTVVTPDELGALDIAIDGADEVDPAFNLTKGGGGAHVRERIVAELAARFVVVVDESKLVDRLGAFGTPLEVLDFAPRAVVSRVEALGAASVTVRETRSDNGNLLMDAHFGAIAHADALARDLDAVPGIVGHGIFLGRTVADVLVAAPDGAVRALSRL
ncbi:MAG: ribose-5-phosphate isomerase RpiA [Jatrophihabitans sp.]|uniref:ribose-5-phosphate isomerase RpiA n=1 Tax=Jatrophihabitans sp. TaxID=1932789 RepID=UPI003F7E2A42